ncbi:unnamed protein product [Porites evermanni]|uniref:EF-hand domain-containing protein n=1 Tax=Porites evermanni TaxID=104178 RepID=A0ABN8LIR5_9CNID|nr:unnamed protein product [Porites evermanni]
MEHRKEGMIALPPVRATANPDHQQENKQLSPLSKWQIQRCSSPSAGFCQEELVNDWLERNHIRVVQRLPKMDPTVLTSRGTDVSKYFSFIHPPPFSIKVLSPEDKRSRENTQRRTALPELTSPCPRLLRSQRSDRDAFALNPVIRVGGGYRRLSWKVLDVLPSIGQYDPDFSPGYRCTSCNARLLVTEKITNSRGKIRTILATPKRCHKCGTPTMDYQALTGNDLHESVLDTLSRRDTRFIVDHRHFNNAREPRSSPKDNARVSPVSSSLDWHDDMESFRLHMSRQSQIDDELEARYQVSQMPRSESGDSVFITEPGADIDKISEPRDVRRAWDDGSDRAEVTKEYEDRMCLRRKTFGETAKPSDLIQGNQDEKGVGRKSKEQRTEIKERKHGHYEEKFARKEKATSKPKRKRKTSKQIPVDQKTNKPSRSGEVVGDEEEIVNVEQKVTKADSAIKKYKTSLPRMDSFYTVGLDRRDLVFSSEPVIEVSDEDDFIINPETRVSGDSLSDPEFIADSWSSVSRRSGLERRPSKPSPSDQVPFFYSKDVNYFKDTAEPGGKKPTLVAERSDSRRLSGEDGLKKTPVTNGDWDSDWDSDFSLHVHPLSELSMSSSEEDHWQKGGEGKTSKTGKQERLRKESDKTVSNAARRKESRLVDTDQHKGTLKGGTGRDEISQGSAGETPVRQRKSSKKTIVKPIPTIGSGSESDDITPRQRMRVPRDEDDLSESDLIYFTQQFQAPRSRESHGRNTTEEGPLRCRGIDCYRCGAHISECQGLCAKCGTMCQRPGGPCSACRDICENCNKPRYKCTSACRRLKITEDIEVEEEDGNVGSDVSLPSFIENSRPEDSSAEKDELYLRRSQSEHAEEISITDQVWRLLKERKNRGPPTERKKKDLNNVKRVRAKINQMSLNVDEENNLEKEIETEMDEEPEAEEEKDPELFEPLAKEDVPSKPEPSAYSSSSIRKAKPSKKVISRTVVYKERDKPSKTKPKGAEEEPDEEDNGSKNGSVVVSQSPFEETEEITEERPVTVSEETGKGELSTEPRTGEETVPNRNDSNKDEVKTELEETKWTETNENVEKEKEMKEKEKKEEERKKQVVPKVRGVMRVNAAFKERAELAKRLKSVLKDAISDVIGQADIKTRKDSTIDYIAQYRLVNRSHLEMYGRAFTLEDEDEDGLISYEQMLLALEGVPSVAGMSRKQLMFVLQVLDLFPGSRITFKMFSVTTALCEKVMTLDEFVRQLVEEIDLYELECKLDMFRKMFFVTGDYSVNFITADQLRIELKAGGLNQQQENHVIGHILQSTQAWEISFLDYMAYLPLFLSIHQNICDNALDMSRDKYRRHDTT